MKLGGGSGRPGGGVPQEVRGPGQQHVQISRVLKQEVEERGKRDRKQKHTAGLTHVAQPTPQTTTGEAQEVMYPRLMNGGVGRRAGSTPAAPAVIEWSHKESIVSEASRIE